MIIEKDESESLLKKRVMEDSRFYTMTFPSFGYTQDVFELKIQALADYYESIGYMIEKVTFFRGAHSQNSQLFARISMQEKDHIIEPN